MIAAMPLRARLWLALAAAPAAWVVHGLGGVITMTLACRHARPALGRSLVLAITVTAIAAAISSGTIGYTSWRRLTREHAAGQGVALEQDETLALLVLLIGVAFTVGIAWGGLPMLLIGDVCEDVR